MDKENNLKVIAARDALISDIDQVKNLYNVQTNYLISIMGGPSIYNLTDLDDKKDIGIIMLERSDYYPGSDECLYYKGELQKKLVEMLQTPKIQLKKLVESNEILATDIKELEEFWGASFYVPHALPLEERILNGQKQLLNLTTELYDARYYNSSNPVGKLYVNISEYVPGKNYYADDSIYKKGDLQKELVKDSKLFSAYIKNVLSNVVYSGIYASSVKKIQWELRATNLKRDFPQFF
ncbi:MAG: hypothetical protein ACP5N1_05950 [Candidatus Woesearchaeota archaeon]